LHRCYLQSRVLNTSQGVAHRNDVSFAESRETQKRWQRRGCDAENEALGELSRWGWSCLLLVADGDQFLRGAEAQSRQRGLHRQDAVLAQRRLDGLRVGSLRQEELAVVFPVHRLAFCLLFVLSVDLKHQNKPLTYSSFNDLSYYSSYSAQEEL